MVRTKSLRAKKQCGSLRSFGDQERRYSLCFLEVSDRWLNLLNIASVPTEVTFPFTSTTGQGVPNVLSPATNNVIASEHLIVLKKTRYEAAQISEHYVLPQGEQR